METQRRWRTEARDRSVLTHSCQSSIHVSTSPIAHWPVRTKELWGIRTQIKAQCSVTLRPSMAFSSCYYSTTGCESEAGFLLLLLLHLLCSSSSSAPPPPSGPLVVWNMKLHISLWQPLKVTPVLLWLTALKAKDLLCQANTNYRANSESIAMRSVMEIESWIWRLSTPPPVSVSTSLLVGLVLFSFFFRSGWAEQRRSLDGAESLFPANTEVKEMRHHREGCL